MENSEKTIELLIFLAMAIALIQICLLLHWLIC
jgi:hypothetical protein